MEYVLNVFLIKSTNNRLKLADRNVIRMRSMMEINVNAKMVIILYMVYALNVFRMRITNNKLRLVDRNVGIIKFLLTINVFVNKAF